MEINFLNIPVSNIYTKPNIRSEVSTQILYGEKFKIFNKKRGWLKIKTNFDNYIGYIRKKNLEKILNLNLRFLNQNPKFILRKKTNFHLQRIFSILLQVYQY